MGQVITLESPAQSRAIGDPLEPRNQWLRTDGVFVIFTSVEETLAAVPVAARLAKRLGVPLTLVHTRCVSYQLPVDAPNGLSPVETEDFMQEMHALAREAGVDMRVRVYLCRDVRTVVPQAFKPRSLIVLAGRRSWWPTRTERWRHLLEDAGHFAVFVDRREQGETNRA